MKIHWLNSDELFLQHFSYIRPIHCGLCGSAEWEFMSALEIQLLAKQENSAYWYYNV